MDEFYNYHEYACPENDNIIITHHPNPYTSDGTRVVRIPLLPEPSYPQFSTQLPGNEPAAIPSDANHFRGIYTWKGQRFGMGSISPLSNYITRAEFESIVTKINSLLWERFGNTWFNFWWVIINMLMYDLPRGSVRIWTFLTGTKDKLESYINEVNKRFDREDRNIGIVSPEKNGFVSLDWIIPSQAA